MEDVLNNNITETDNTSELEPTATLENKEAETKSEYIAPDEDTYKRVLQSERSKAKYEMLQELGVKSIDEFKKTKLSYENAIKESDNVRLELEEIKSKYAKLEENIKLEKLGVLDEYKDDFITIVKSKVTEERDFDTVAKEVLEKNTHWLKGTNDVRLTSEKSESKKDKPQVSDYLKSKYPWLH